MHCKIIELTDESMNRSDYMNMNTILYDQEWFIKTICDYVSDIFEDEREKILENHLNKNGLLYFGDKITIRSANDYFSDRYNKMKESAERIVKASLDSFAKGSIWNDIWTINDCYDDKFGDYIYYDDCLSTMDEFVRHHEGESFYIGGVVDYHY